MISAIFQLVLLIFLPKLIRFAITFVKRILGFRSASSGGGSAGKNSKSLKARLITMTLFAIPALYYFHVGYLSSHPNFFKTIGGPIQNQYYMTRLLFRKYAEAQSRTDPSFPADIDSKAGAVGSSFDGEGEDGSQGEDQQGGSSAVNKEFLRMQKIFEKVSSKSMRRAMFNFGEEAMLNCDYCVDLHDYFYFIIPDLAFSYIGIILFWGLGTAPSNRLKWRAYGMFVIILTAVMEIYVHVSGDRSFDPDIMSINREKNSLRYENIVRMRNLIFCFLMLFISVVLELGIVQEDGAAAQGPDEISYELALAVRNAKNLNGVLSIMRNAIFLNESLRKHYMKDMAGKEEIRNIYSLSEEYKSTSEKIYQRHDMARLFREAGKYFMRECS